MTLCTADFELGTLGATIATGDAGSATAFNTVTIGANSTLQYANDQLLHGTKNAKLVMGTPSPTAASMNWSTAMGTVTDHYGRMYFRFAQNWGTDPTVEFYSGASLSCRVMMNGTNSLLIRDQSDATVAGPSTFAGSLNTWYRIEWHVVHSVTVGTVELRAYAGDSLTPIDTLTSGSINTLASCNEVRIGQPSNNTSWTLWFDDLVSGAPTWPGIWTAPAAGVYPLPQAARVGYTN